MVFCVQDLSLRGDSQPAESKSDTCRHCKSHKRRRVDRQGPIGFRRRNSLCPLSIQNGRVKFTGFDRGIELSDGTNQPFHIDLKLHRELLDGGSLCLSDLADAVLIAQKGQYLRVEDLKGGPLRLGEDAPSVFSVGVVAKVCPFIKEALSLDIDDYPEGIGVLLKKLSNFPVAEGRGVEIPGNGVTRAPVAERLCPNIEGHLNPIAGVVGRAPDFGELPVLA